MFGRKDKNAEAARPLSPKKKAKRKKAIIGAVIGCAAVVAAVIGVRTFMVSNSASANDSVTVSSAQAESGDVATTIDSSGSIENTGTVSVEIPSDIEITEVLVSEGETVNAGDKLAAVDVASVAEVLVDINDTIDDLEDEIDDLEDDDDSDEEGTDEYYTLISYNAKLADLEELQTLTEEIYESGYIVASSSGVIDSINTGSSDSSSGSSEGTVGSVTSSEDVELVSTIASIDVSGSMITASSSSTSSSATDTSIDESYVNKNLSVTAPVTGAAPQMTITETDEYTGTITWNLTGSTFAASTSYTAQIVLTSSDGYAFTTEDDYAITISGATVSKVELKGTANTSGNRLVITAVFQATEASSSSSSSLSSSSGSDSSSSTATDTSESTSTDAASANTTASTDTTSSADDSSSSSKTASDSSSSSSASSSGSSGSSSSSSSSSEDTSYTVSTTEVFTIASSDEATISVSVDELDIGSVEIGQNATVTLDAFEDDEFTGTVTDVSASSSSSGTYTVEVTIPREDGMLAGMSATVTINIEEVNDVIVIPVSALVESSDGYYVYTEADDEGNLSGETQVEVGLSNGTYAEITSGLSIGDTVYYTKEDSTDSSSSDMSGMGGMGGMGGGPSGGDMPSGGGSGGSGSSGGGHSGGGQGGGPGGN